MEKNRICPCQACSSAVNLELKIIVHTGNLQFLTVQNNRKPFGEPVIQAHRLLKNSVDSDNYVLLSKELATDINMAINYKSSLFNFFEGVDTYDNKEIGYLFSEISTQNLKLKPFHEEHLVEFDRPPNLVFERNYKTSTTELLELITNYKYRHLWAAGADEIHYDENEVTRLGTEHMCVVGNKHLDFKVITKQNKTGELVYGEETRSLPPVDVMYQFFNISAVSDNEVVLRVELFWEAKSIFKKIMIQLLAKKGFIKNINQSLDNLNGLF